MKYISLKQAKLNESEAKGRDNVTMTFYWSGFIAGYKQARHLYLSLFWTALIVVALAFTLFLLPK